MKKSNKEGVTVEPFTPQPKGNIPRAVISARSGPMPAPNDIKEYSKYIKNAGERFMTIVEKRNYHAIRLEYLKYFIGFTIVGIIIYAAVWLSNQGHDNVAMVLVGGTSVIGISNLLSVIFGRNK